MIETCKDVNGQGLAANQIGINKQIFIYFKIETGEYIAVINPKIKARSGKFTFRDESCLSIPDKNFDIRRSKMVIIEALDQHGNPIIIKSKHKYEAQCFQHEIDHLNGKTLIDKEK
jgi:peptide deformylase